MVPARGRCLKQSVRNAWRIFHARGGMNRIIVGGVVLGLLWGCRGKEPEAASGFIVFQLSTVLPDSHSETASGVVTAGKDTIFLQRVRMVLAELAIAPSLANDCEEEEGEDNPACV